MCIFYEDMPTLVPKISSNYERNCPKTQAHVITLTILRVKFFHSPYFAINFAIFQLDVMWDRQQQKERDGNVRKTWATYAKKITKKREEKFL